MGVCGKWSLAQFRGGALLLLVARPPIIKLQPRSTDRPTCPFDSAALALLIIVYHILKILPHLLVMKVQVVARLITLTLEYELRWQGHAWSFSTCHHFNSRHQKF